MSKKLKISILCNEATHICDKSQYKESSLWEKVKLYIHLLYCNACRKYAKNNAKLTSVITKSKITYMDKNDKDVLKKDFDKAVKEHTFTQK